MTQPAKGQEPSMEEILASIRRIIADDEPANETTESRQDTVATARESAAQLGFRSFWGRKRSVTNEINVVG